MFFKIIRTSLCHQVNGDAGSIGADQRAWFTVFLYFRKDLLFDIQSFHYHFDDPVTAGDIFHVIGEITGRYLLDDIPGIDGGGVEFDGGGQRLIDDPVLYRRVVRRPFFSFFRFRQLLWCYVKQQSLNTADSKVTADPRPHYTASQYTNFFYYPLHMPTKLVS